MHKLCLCQCFISMRHKSRSRCGGGGDKGDISLGDSKEGASGQLSGCRREKGAELERVPTGQIKRRAGLLGDEDQKLCFDGGRDEGREIQFVKEISDGAQEP
jgi:hypothetical protein